MERESGKEWMPGKKNQQMKEKRKGIKHDSSDPSLETRRKMVEEKGNWEEQWVSERLVCFETWVWRGSIPQNQKKPSSPSAHIGITIPDHQTLLWIQLQDIWRMARSQLCLLTQGSSYHSQLPQRWRSNTSGLHSQRRGHSTMWLL